jgi:hypothetical protein
MHLTSRALAVGGLILACSAAWADDTDAATYRRVSISVAKEIANEGTFSLCNAVVYSQVPGHTNIFLGRVLNARDGRCDGTGWSLGRFEMDWAKSNLELREVVLRLPTKTPDGIQINQGYDPYVASHRGALWVAFECTVSQTVSMCVAPYSVVAGLNISKLSVPVVGRGRNPKDPDGHSASASVPKLLSHKGRLYAFWSPVLQSNQDGRWLSVASRGAELSLDRRTGRLWVVGSAGKPVPSDDGKLTSAVINIDPNDGTRDTIGEMMDVRSVGDKLVALVSRGGSEAGEPCLNSESKARPCYQLSAVYARDPIAHGAFDRKPEAEGIPSNPQAYARFITGPDGTTNIFSMFHRFQLDKLPRAAPVDRGLFYYPTQIHIGP